jgi:hypothetical protein
MKSLVRAVILWSALATIGWLLIQPVSPAFVGIVADFGRLALPAAAALLTFQVIVGLPASRAWRWSFWAVTLAGWLTVFLLAAGRYENAANGDERQLLLLTGAGALTFLMWAVIKAKAFPSWGALRDAAAGLAILALTGAVFLWSYTAKARAIEARAEARWVEIGLPMAEFEKSLAPVVENAGSEVVRQVFREHLNQRFYKEGTRAAEREPMLTRSEEAWELVTRACDIISAKLPPSDDLDLSRLPIAVIEPHAGALDAAYRRILATEPAVWACDPADGPGVSAPNFLGLRMFSQLAAAESMRRLAVGDEEGAARAISAGLRLREGLNRTPALVPLMISVAIDALLAPRQARLAATGDGLAAIARDRVTMQTAFLRTLQWESWICLRHSERMINGDYDSGGFHYLPKWARRLADRHFMRRECAQAALNNAEHAAIRQSAATLALADFGAQLDEAISQENPSVCEPNFTRAAMRIYATLLLREQTELIRDARARLADGRPVESRDSVVLPGVRWELQADPGKRTVSTRLVNAPKWVVENAVTGSGDDFWLVPIDGSVAWQFRSPVKGVAAQ